MRLYKLNDKGLDWIGKEYKNNVFKVDQVTFDKSEFNDTLNNYNNIEIKDLSDWDFYRISLKNIYTGEIVSELMMDEIEEV